MSSSASSSNLSSFFCCSFLKQKPWLLSMYISWSSLGFVRGMNLSKHFHNNHFQVEHFSWGLLGIFLYNCPFLFPFLFVKELKRLEYGLNDKTRYYMTMMDYHNLF